MDPTELTSFNTPKGGIIINPGSGPVEGATYDDAADNMEHLQAELMDRGAKRVDWRTAGRGHEGRYLFDITVDGKEHSVEMPGLPIEKVRYRENTTDNIWNFPRLYVDGSSWVWPFAVRMCLKDEDDE